MDSGIRAFFIYRIPLQDCNSLCGCLVVDLIRPYGYLNLSDVGFPQEEHTDSGLADAAADGLRQFAVKECLLEWQLSPLFAACFF